MKQTFLQKLADNRNPKSFANKIRKKRIFFFEKEFNHLLNNHSAKILDLGGEWNFWKKMGFSRWPDVQITLLNTTKEDTFSDNITSMAGDACDLSGFPDKYFDIVFSNSVIEHVGNLDRQKQMAKEVIRVGKSYFIQTPNYWFPLELHSLVPGFHFYPLWFRRILVQNFNLGCLGKHPDKDKALEVADSIHLLTTSVFKSLFPDSMLIKERFMFMIKSLVVVKHLKHNH